MEPPNVALLFRLITLNGRHVRPSPIHPLRVIFAAQLGHGLKTDGGAMHPS
jgi:hypothetical protein